MEGTAMQRSTVAILFALLIISLAPMAGAVTFGSFGARVEVSSQDFNPTYAALGTTPTICSRDHSGTVGDLTDDIYYINMDGAGTTVAQLDVRLTSGGGFSPGTVVRLGDSDASQTFDGLACTAFAANLRYAEADGLMGFTAGDMLVWSTDASLGGGDVRLAVGTSASGQNSMGVQTGSVIQGVTDTDVVNVANNDGLYPDCTPGAPINGACASTAVLLGAGSFALRFSDLNLNSAFDQGDLLMAAFSPGTTPAPTSPTINDVHLVTANQGGVSATFGARVTGSSSEYLREPELFTVAPSMTYARALGADSNCDFLWIHFREYQGTSVIQMNDVSLYAPQTSITSCANPPPTSSAQAGTRVTSTSTGGQGTAFLASTPLAAQIFYVDQDSDGVFDPPSVFTTTGGDPVYINRPLALGGPSDALTVTAGDIRLTPVKVGSTQYSAGTIVGTGQQDINTFAGLPINNEAGKSWVVRKYNPDGANEINLNSLQNARYVDANSNMIWDPATEEVYLASSTTVAAGDIRIHAADSGLGAGPTTAVLAGDGDVGATLVSLSDFRTTGSDGTFDNGRGEIIVYSRDTILNDEDWVIQVAAGSTVALGQVGAGCPASLCLDEGMHTSDIMYASWCTGGACPGRLLPTDIVLSGTTFGSGVSRTPGTEFQPTLQPFPTAGGTLARINRDDQSTVLDDTFYMISSGTAINSQTVRVLPYDSGRPAGSWVRSTDTTETAGTPVLDTTGGFAAHIMATDVDGVTGYSLEDAVYIDIPTGAMGGTSAGALSQYDIRLTSVTAGSNTYSAGTPVLLGQSDLNGGAAFLAGAWSVVFYDDNLNGVFDDGDVAYALPPAAAGATQPPLGAIRLNGAAATGGGGGGYVPPSPPPTTSPPPTSAPPPPPTTAPPPVDTETEAAVASGNTALAGSLGVTRVDGNNLLSWSAVDGAGGYQVWRSTSPWVLLWNLGPSETSFIDIGGPADGKYIVTVWMPSDVTGTVGVLQDINTQSVAGNTGLASVSAPAPSTLTPTETPTETPATTKDGPGAGFVLVGLVLVGAVLAIRRRL